FMDRLYARTPGLAERRAAKTLSLEEVARYLPSDTALLDYVVLKTGNRGQTLLFCVTLEAGKPVLAVYPVKKPGEELANQVERFRMTCAGNLTGYRGRAQELYQLLLAPAARQLAGKRRLIICPDGPLWGLPFQALLVPGETSGSEQ